MFDLIKTAIFSVFKMIVNFFVELVCDFINFLLTPIAESLPELSWDISFFVPYLNLANCFFDFSFALFLFLAYCLFALTITIINYILGLIPTIN